jgi:K+-sensing histidine kinase KdpD
MNVPIVDDNAAGRQVGKPGEGVMGSGLLNAIPGPQPNAPLTRIGRAAGACGLALLLVGLATALTALLWPHNQYAAFTFYYPAVLVVTRFVNRGAGLLAALLAALVADYLFVPPDIRWFRPQRAL